jgi:16S rRNA (guanine527-N7)-methyltransferase
MTERPPPESAAERPPLPDSAAELSPLGPEFNAAVVEHAAELGLSLETTQLAAIEAHARLLLAWNRHVNLTAIRDSGGVARLHVADSLTAVPGLASRAGPGMRLLDFGSGGGYPGLVLASVLPFGQVGLLDSVAKKVRFLDVAGRSVAEALGADAPRITAIRARAEELAGARETRETWDVVTVRAVGSLAEIAELGLPLLRIGGELVAWKRDDAESSRPLSVEIDDARSIVRAAGGAVEKIETVAPALLPGHVLVRLTKVRATPALYPREPARRRRS